MSASEDLLDVAGVARRLNTTERHVRRMVFERRIPFTKIGGKLRFDPVRIEAWIAERAVEVTR